MHPSTRQGLLIAGGLAILPLMAMAVFGLTSKDSAEGTTSSARAGGAAVDARASGVVSPPPNQTSAVAQSAAPSVERDQRVAEALRVQTRDPARSRRLLRDVIQDDPDNVRALAALAVKLLSDENHSEARKLALRCLRLAPSNEACDQTRRYALTPYNSGDKAVGFLGNCLERDPNNLACLSGRVVEHVRAGEFSQAEKLTAQLEQVHPSASLTHLSRARVASAQADYRGALAEFSKACDQGQEYACYRAATLRAEGW